MCSHRQRLKKLFWSLDHVSEFDSLWGILLNPPLGPWPLLHSQPVRRGGVLQNHRAWNGRDAGEPEEDLKLAVIEKWVTSTVGLLFCRCWRRTRGGLGGGILIADHSVMSV